MRIDWMGPFEGPVGDHRMVRNGLLQDKETENGQMEGRESRVTGVIKKKPTERARREKEPRIVFVLDHSPLTSLPSFVCFFGWVAFPKRDNNLQHLQWQRNTLPLT